MAPRPAADGGTAATLAPPNPLARLRLQPAHRASARGARIGRFLAADDRVLAPARQLLEHRSRALSLRAATSPRSDRPRCCGRTARADGPAPAGRGHRCTSAPPFDDARPAGDGFVIRAAATSPATSGLPALPGVAALLRVHPSQHRLRLVPGALPPSSPPAFWRVRAAVIAGCCDRSWSSCDAPRTLLQALFANKCWLYMPSTRNMSVVRIAWGRTGRMATNRAGRQWRRSRCLATSCASTCTASWPPSPTRSPATRPPP
jgi:hypothetical protein